MSRVHIIDQSGRVLEFSPEEAARFVLERAKTTKRDEHQSRETGGTTMAQTRQFEARLDRVDAGLRTVRSSGTRDRAKPLIDAAVSRGAIPHDARDTFTRLFEDDFDNAQKLIEARSGNRELADRNFWNEHDDLDAAFRADAAQRLGVRPGDVL
jgi:hypothetical protein